MLRRLTMLCLLIAAGAAVSTKVTSKAQRTEKRLGNLVGQLGNLNFEALAQFTSPANTAFLAGLSQIPLLPSDSNSGPYWGTGERNYYNTLLGDMQVAGLVAP